MCTERRTECETHPPTERHDDSDRDCTDAAAGRGTSRADRHHQNQEAARKQRILPGGEVGKNILGRALPVAALNLEGHMC